MEHTLSASLEDYLEAISLIIKEKSAVRGKDIAKHLQVSGASVTGALHALADKGLVHYVPYDVITLTPEGHRLANDIITRHETLKSFLHDILALDLPTAEATACELEHIIKQPVLDRLISFVDFLHACPRAGKRWIYGLAHQCEAQQDPDNCVRCIERCLDETNANAKR